MGRWLTAPRANQAFRCNCPCNNNEAIDLASRITAFIDRSTACIVSRFNVKGSEHHIIPKYNGVVSMLFLDPKQPLITCESDSCDDCTINTNLHCHFSLKDWINFLLIAFPPFLLGGAGIKYLNGWLLIPWITFVVAIFGFVEIRVMCSHCPHYSESLKSLKCWANYGSPKLWKYRPGPMTIFEKTFFLEVLLLFGDTLYHF